MASRVFVLVVFLFPGAPAIAAGASPTGTRASRKPNLLEAIRMNLRKDNDDYTDLTPAAPTLHSYTSKPIRRANDEQLADGLLIENNVLDFGHNAGAYDKKVPHKDANKKNEMINPINIDVFKNIPAVATTPKSFPRFTTQRRTPTKPSVNKMEKIKKFYEKNKILLKEFLSSKIAARTKSSLTSQMTSKQGLRQAQSTVSDDASDEGPDARTLNPDLLDMMPAVGARIHFRRQEGRLCQRHVLIPEGPKYDSKGRVYLSEHARSVRRPYAATRRPRLLLPRCCNCCKKSVLGCE